jgi:hypothetical protein
LGGEVAGLADEVEVFGQVAEAEAGHAALLLAEQLAGAA